MSENIVNNPPVHLQAGLTKVGDLVTNNRPFINKMGRLKMARIQSINRRTGTVRVTAANNKSANRHGVLKPHGEKVRLPVHGYGVNTTGQYFGQFPHVGVGELVLIGHVDGDAGTPIVINAYADKGVMKHITPTDRLEAKSNKDAYFDDFRAQKEVYPSQHVSLHTGTGNYEHTWDGNSVSAILNPGSDTGSVKPVWRNDYYTGLPEDTQYGVPMEATKDKADGSTYPIQNAQAQDWLRIHQSNVDGDHHITKRLVKNTGETHNFWGSKVFKNDALVENADLDKGYELYRHSGKMNGVRYTDLIHVANYAKSQVGKHPYTEYTINDHPKEKPHQTWHFNDEIFYEPSPKSKKYGSGSDKNNFIWSVLHQCGYTLLHKPTSYVNTLVDDMKKVKGSPKPGQVAVLNVIPKKVAYQKRVLNKDDLSFPANPCFIVGHYKGLATKVVGESKRKHNVIKSTLGYFKHVVNGRHNVKRTYFSFYTLPKTYHTGAGFRLGNNNEITLDDTDPNTVGTKRSNVFRLTHNSGEWRVMGHSLKLNRKGVFVDGRQISSGKNNVLGPVERLIRKLIRSVNRLVYNLNDRDSKLSYVLARNALLNEQSGRFKRFLVNYASDPNISTWSQQEQNMRKPVKSDYKGSLINTAKKYLGSPYQIGNYRKDPRHTDCSGFVWACLKNSGDYRYPNNVFDTIKMVNNPSSCNLIPVSSNETKPNDIFVVNNGAVEHTGILMDSYDGLDTPIIEDGGAHLNVNISTLGEAIPTVDTDELHFYRPQPINQPKRNIYQLPSDDDIITPFKVIGGAKEVGNSVERGVINWCNNHGLTINQTAGILGNVEERSDFQYNDGNYLALPNIPKEDSIRDYFNYIVSRFADEFTNYEEREGHSAFNYGYTFSKTIIKPSVSSVSQEAGETAQKIALQIAPPRSESQTSLAPNHYPRIEVNFRDFASYKTSDGKYQVKPNSIFRSNSLHRLSSAGVSLLKGFGVNTDIDLRTTQESRRNPDAKISGINCISLPVFTEQYSNQVSEEANKYHYPPSLYRYRYLFTSPHAIQDYRKIFKDILDDTVVFHCTAGRDRTGIVSVLFLTALGIDPNVIRQDYLLTGHYEPGSPSSNRMNANLNGFLDTINIKFGGLRSFLVNTIGLSSSDIEALRRKYLEPVSSSSNDDIASLKAKNNDLSSKYDNLVKVLKSKNIL